MQLVKTIATIGGIEFSFNNLNLTQVYNGHHSLEVGIDYSLDDKINLSLVQQFLGKQIKISVKPVSTSKENEEITFAGYVDEINPSWSRSYKGFSIRCYGYSMLLDTTPKYRTFNNVTIADIVREIKSGYKKYVQIICEGQVGETKVDFAFQYQETDYQFLCRMADAYHLICCYVDRNLVLMDWEEFKSKNTDPLTLGSQVSSINMSINANPMLISLSGHSYEEAPKEPTSVILNTNSEYLIPCIVKCSNQIYEKQNVVTNKETNRNQLAKETSILVANQAQNLARFHGSSNSANLNLGQKISLTDEKDKTKDEIFEKGSFVITQITHQVASDGTYYNSFSAFPDNFKFPFKMNNYQKPISSPVIGTVIDNNDERKMGRVKVKFRNDQNSKTKESPWLRVLQPFTGRKGWYFLPEVGDEVLVQFEGFDPESRPFVSGSFYHQNRSAADWYMQGNHKKGFATDKVKFEIDDQSGKLIIEAEDIEFIAKNSMNIDGGSQLTQKATRIDLN